MYGVDIQMRGGVVAQLFPPVVIKVFPEILPQLVAEERQNSQSQQDTNNHCNVHVTSREKNAVQVKVRLLIKETGASGNICTIYCHQDIIKFTGDAFTGIVQPFAGTS